MNLRSVTLHVALAEEAGCLIGQGCDQVPDDVRTLAVQLDASQWLADVALLTQAAKRSLQVRQRLLDLGDLAAHLIRIDADLTPALGAGQLGIRLEFSDGLAQLVSAVRTGDFDSLVVQDVFHG